MRATNQIHARAAEARAAIERNVPYAKVAAKVRRTALPAANAAAKGNFNHWWHAPEFRALKQAGLTPDDAKVALVYECTRRRPEVVAAAAANIIPREWQRFTGLCVAWQSNTWADLMPDQKARVQAAFCDPCYLPPIGLSVFPRDCQQAERSSLIIMDRLCPDEMERLQVAGFTVCAVDTKSSQAIKTAGVALLKRPRTCRKADVMATITTGEREIPNGIRLAATADVTLPTRIRFNFERICRELEQFDRDGTASDFISRIRL